MDEKIDRILSESLQLFKKFGIRSVSMDDIAKELGMSKKTNHQYKGDKIESIKCIMNPILGTYN